VVDTSCLRQAIPDGVLGLCNRLAGSGHRGWIVGGCVRDRLLGALRPERAVVPGGDWDIATDALPEEVRGLFRRVIPTGIRHGTVTVVFGGQGYEVTTLRAESTYTDGRHPDQVRFVRRIEDDLARRDFTMNALAYDPLADELIDPFRGLGDLLEGRLRAVGDARERFAEDGLRVLRAARFVATLEVTLDRATAEAIEPSLESYRRVSPERIRDEWLKALKARAPSRAFEIMRRHGLLAITAPELLELVGCEQNRHHAFDVWQHTLGCLDGCPPEPLLRLGALLHDLGKPRSRAIHDDTGDYTFYEHERLGAEMADQLLVRLRFSRVERETVVGLVRHHLIAYDGDWTDAAVRRWIRRVGPERVSSLIALGRADVGAKGRDVTQDLTNLDALERHVGRVLVADAALSVNDLEVDGHDLMRELAIGPGPELGRLLRALLDLVTDDPSQNQRERLLARARVLYAGRP
jgi:tRNA nucleotidyltransferase (CCA-adding enzyme)